MCEKLKLDSTLISNIFYSCIIGWDLWNDRKSIAKWLRVKKLFMQNSFEISFKIHIHFVLVLNKFIIYNKIIDLFFFSSRLFFPFAIFAFMSLLHSSIQYNSFSWWQHFFHLFGRFGLFNLLYVSACCAIH